MPLGGKAASWVWILAPPELSGLPHSQVKDYCPDRKICNHMDPKPSTPLSTGWNKHQGRSCTIPPQPSEQPKLISKSLCFNHVHPRPEQHGGISLKLTYLPWKIHLIPLSGGGTGTEPHKRSRDRFPALSLPSTEASTPLQETSASSAHRQTSKRTKYRNGPAFISEEKMNSYLFSGLQFSPHAAEDVNKRAGKERD